LVLLGACLNFGYHYLAKDKEEPYLSFDISEEEYKAIFQDDGEIMSFDREFLKNYLWELEQEWREKQSDPFDVVPKEFPWKI